MASNLRTATGIKIICVTAPVTPDDVATKQYVDPS
jgi:hypothetical protein